MQVRPRHDAPQFHPHFGRLIALCGFWLTLTSTAQGDTRNPHFYVESGVALPGARQEYSGIVLPTTGWTATGGIACRILTWSLSRLPASLNPAPSRAEMDLTLDVGTHVFSPRGAVYGGYGEPSPTTIGPSTAITITQGIQLGEPLENNPRITMLMAVGFTRVAMSDLRYAPYGYRTAGVRAWTSAFTVGARFQRHVGAKMDVQLTARVVRVGPPQYYENPLMMVPVTLGVGF